jgi:DNA-binding HxlR family transcriptional regulator
MARPYDQTCPIARTLDIIGDRWTLLIVRDLFMGSTRFNQFLESSVGLPPKLLSDRLRKLEEHGLVERAVYSLHPLRAEYRLTEKGRRLGPVLEAMVRWGLKYCFDDEPEAREKIVQRIFDTTGARIEHSGGGS